MESTHRPYLLINLMANTKQWDNEKYLPKHAFNTENEFSKREFTYFLIPHHLNNENPLMLHCILQYVSGYDMLLSVVSLFIYLSVILEKLELYVIYILPLVLLPKWNPPNNGECLLSMRNSLGNNDNHNFQVNITGIIILLTLSFLNFYSTLKNIQK